MNFTSLSTAMPLLEIVLRLGAATVIGCALGLNREIRGKPAGMRTHALVALVKSDTGEQISGLTTAASLWVVACLGIACGVGLWAMALVALGLALFVLIAGETVERVLHRLLGTRGGG